MRICTRKAASRLESGSSKRKTLGFLTIARPIATRCRWPPESSLGFLASSGSSWSTRAASPTLARRSSLGTPASRSEKPILSSTVMCG